MKLESLSPNIMVANVNETLDYYTNVLGFKLIDTNPESGKFEWGYVMLDNVGMMFQEETSLKNEYPELKDLNIGGALTFYIRIGKINELYEKLDGKVNIIKPMNRTFYGTNEFAIMDLNGYILTFSETPEE
ncbi:VOC family protein [Flavivirga eckloniae]|uniref:Glyoxalase n=1 Tax=Flavivirga eckloniae TaxID=1803846 RepID=A0A2K9PWX2_9FLAO|nr:VOC family protein [Flavivirga eckloniae]AUP81559.1 glyoxalase [Flavivirga eckloniae]